jgi:ferritin-like protein
MKEEAQMGMNRTGVQMSPMNTQAMKSSPTGGDSRPMTPGTEAAMAEVRASYISEADQIGSVPVPGTLKGAVTTGASMLTGNDATIFLDKLGERLAFERTGTRLYDALLIKVESLGEKGSMDVGQLRHFRDEEARHFMMVVKAIESLGGDPTAQTPCADVAGVEAMGLVQVITDPRTTLAQSLHAILVAEMTDNNGWEMLIAMARDQGHDQMADDFTSALESEKEHLQKVQQWFEEATLGKSQSGTSKQLH